MATENKTERDIMERTIMRLLLGIIVIICMTWGIFGCATQPINTIPKEQQAQAHLDLAVAYLKAADYTSALRELKDAVKLQPKDPEIHYSIGIAYHGSGLTEKAIEALKYAIDLKSNYSEAHNYIGTIYLANDRYDDAIREFSLALENEVYETPDLALYNMGLVYFKKGEYATAIDKYTRALQRNPNSRIPFLIHKDMGVAYLSERNVTKAISHLQKSIELAPYIAESHYWLGICYLTMKESKSALQEFKSAASADPESVFGKKAQQRVSDLTQKSR